MTNATYTELLAAGNILIDEFGRDISYRPGGTVDLVTGEPWHGKVQAAAVTVKAAIFDATGKDNLNWPSITFNKKAMVSPADITITPSLGDTVTDEGTIYAVVHVVTTKPGDTALLYTLLLTTER